MTYPTYRLTQKHEHRWNKADRPFEAMLLKSHIPSSDLVLKTKLNIIDDTFIQSIVFYVIIKELGVTLLMYSESTIRRQYKVSLYLYMNFLHMLWIMNYEMVLGIDLYCPWCWTLLLVQHVPNVVMQHTLCWVCVV